MNAAERLRHDLTEAGYPDSVSMLDEALAAARREGYDNGLAENPDIGIGAAFAAGRRNTIEQVREAMVDLFLTPKGYTRNVDLTQVHEALDRLAAK